MTFSLTATTINSHLINPLSPRINEGIILLFLHFRDYLTGYHQPQDFEEKILTIIFDII